MTISSRTRVLLALLVGFVSGAYIYSVLSRPFLLDAALDLVWKGHPEITRPLPSRGPYVTRIHFTRHICFGPCPEYVATFNADGTAQIDAKSGTPVVGTIRGPVYFAFLEAWFEHIQFFRLKEYYGGAPDDDVLEISAERNGRVHTVHYSLSGDLPLELRATHAILLEVTSELFERVKPHP